jgi:hypothetical protein
MPTSIEVRCAALLRPFSTRRLSQILGPVQAHAVSLERALQQLLIQPPATPEDWRFELDQIETGLWGIAEHCRLAAPRVHDLMRDADRDYELAVRAMRMMLSGLREGGAEALLASVQPESVPQVESASTGRKSPANGSDPGDVRF